MAARSTGSPALRTGLRYLYGPTLTTLPASDVNHHFLKFRCVVFLKGDKVFFNYNVVSIRK